MPGRGYEVNYWTRKQNKVALLLLDRRPKTGRKASFTETLEEPKIIHGVKSIPAIRNIGRVAEGKRAGAMTIHRMGYHYVRMGATHHSQKNKRVGIAATITRFKRYEKTLE